MLPAPAQLLGIPKFDSWYPGQEHLLMELSGWLSGPDRYAGASVPTGFGKSLIAILLASLSGKRTVYVTSTKGLQAQLLTDFYSLGLVDIRGQNSYRCIPVSKASVESAPCHAGYKCSVVAQCPYYRQLERAKKAKLLVTNYAYWLAQCNYGGGLALKAGQDESNPVQLVVMDEAHLAARALESFLAVTFTIEDLSRFDSPWGQEWGAWREECGQLAPAVHEELEGVGEEVRDKAKDGFDIPASLMQRHGYLKGLELKLDTIARSGTEWIKEQGESSVSFTPLWARDYNHKLFRGTPKVLLMSGILTRKTLEHLGVEGAWVEAKSPFDRARSPVTHVKTVRVDHRSTPEMMAHWVARVDDIIRARQDRKGLVFTVSYERAKLLRGLSAFKDQMYVHGSRDVVEVVAKFKGAPAPAVLVSPAVTTGWDFPGDECSYIIWGKVPWPDTRGALVKARMENDKDFAAWQAMETLVQGAGRGTRSQEDACETLIVDDNWTWYWRRNKHFSPYWFQERVKGSVGVIPEPI